MLKFGFIGIGQVGGLFADAAKSKDHKALAINTAMIDLKGLNHLEKQEKIHLIGYGGAGKDRSLGEEAFLSHQDMIMEKLSEAFDECQVLFPVFAMGGGTGSGMGPLLAKTMTEVFPDKVISPILFLPERGESPRANMNALESFSAMSAIEDIGAVFLIDNQKVMDLNQSFTLKEKHENTRSELLSFFDFFNQATNKDSSVSNLDEMDLLMTFSERGCALITELSLDENDAKSPKKIGERLEKALEFSIFANSSTKGISKAALIAEIQPKLTTHLKFESIFNEMGMPLDLFIGIYEKDEKSKLHAFLSGLSFPMIVLKEIEEEIRKKEENIIKTLSSTRTQTFDVKSSWTHSLKRNRKVKL